MTNTVGKVCVLQATSQGGDKKRYRRQAGRHVGT